MHHHTNASTLLCCLFTIINQQPRKRNPETRRHTFTGERCTVAGTGKHGKQWDVTSGNIANQTICPALRSLPLLGVNRGRKTGLCGGDWRRNWRISKQQNKHLISLAGHNMTKKRGKKTACKMPLYGRSADTCVGPLCFLGLMIAGPRPAG